MEVNAKDALCPGCDCPFTEHYASVAGPIRCTSVGMIILGTYTRCDCLDYVSAAVSRHRKRVADSLELHKQRVDHILRRFRN